MKNTNKIYFKSPFESENLSEYITDLQNKLDVSNINLIPSENILTSNVRKAFLFDVGNRYHLPTNYLNNTTPSRKELHNYLIKLTKRMRNYYNCEWIDLRPISGLNMMSTLLGALNDDFKYFASLGRSLGGHSVTQSLAKKFGYDVSNIPSKNNSFDFEEIKKLSEKNSGTFFYIDHSICLEIFDVKKFLSVLRKEDILFYDISHLNIFWAYEVEKIRDSRLLFGGTFHKSFPGPHKAFVGAYLKNKYVQKISDFLNISVSSPHISNYIALDFALKTMESVGKTYKEKIVYNANILAKALDKHYEVAKINSNEYTRTHQIWVKVSDFNKFTYDCAKIGLSVYRNYIPIWDGYHMRLGVQEITYMGMSEEHIKIIAKAIILANKNNQHSKAKRLIKQLIKEVSNNE
jgi:glycine hydroxymethyltransferase